MSSMTVHILRCGTIRVPRGHSPFAQRQELPVWCYLVAHPAHGPILVDTGLGTLPLPGRLRRYYDPDPQPTVAEQLARLGIRPADLAMVLLSDLDVDHTGGLHTLTAAPRFLVSEEEYYWTCRRAFSRRQPGSFWDGHVHLETYYLRGTTLGPAKHSLDIFGDGSLTSVLTAGHTFGCCTTLLRWNGKTLLLAGNAVRDGRTLKDDYVYHPYQQEKTVRWLRTFRDDPSCLGILATHDAGETERIIRL